MITRPTIRRRQILCLTVLGIGLVFQLIVIVTAENHRAAAITTESLTQWVSHIPVAVGTLIPLDTQLTGSGMIEATKVPPNQFVGFISLAAVLVLSWIPGFDASEFRFKARPSGAEMLGAIENGCQMNPSGDPRVTFSPDWPFSCAIFLGPTSNLVSCEQLIRLS